MTTRPRTILDLFEQQTTAAPERPALAYGEDRWTYGALDGLAEDLARPLRAAGVRPGRLVPLLVGDGPALPIAMLALLKLGAAFVPLDETWPAARLDIVLDDLDSDVVVCHPAFVDLAGRRSALAVELDVLDPSTPRHSAAGRLSVDLAYGYYTSGSTGRPKCALNAHHGLLNRFQTMSRRFQDDGAVVLQNSRHVFDSSLWQLLWPLTAGNQVVIPIREGILDLTETVATIAEHGVTMTDFVPSVFNTLVAVLESDEQMAQRLSSLRRVLIGGEEASARAVATFLRLLPDVRVTNTYGPTECSIGSVFHELDGAAPVPLGRAIDNTFAVVLDENQRPVAPGEQGEICIGGECVGLGYLNDSERTARAFVDNPLAGVASPLLYRTGDQGWKDADGVLYFAGRRDHQVKIGGVRIELSEIEAALTTHSDVLDARVVLTRQNETGRLVAFIVATGALDIEELRVHVAGQLPPTSVPRQIVVLDRFPLTANGKADRVALVQLAAAADADQAGDAAHPAHGPETETERKVQAIWSDLLGIDAVDVTTSFFALGGDSLGAHRLVIALTPIAGRRLKIQDVLTHSTVRALAALLDGEASTVDSRQNAAPRIDHDRLKADSVLHPAIQGAPCEEPWTLDRVLLTGATGFVGAHLLVELLTAGARVECLVRANDHHTAWARLHAALARYGLAPTSLHRVRVHLGDVAQPRLGLSLTAYDELTKLTGTVVHAAAAVNLLLDYDALRASNVEGTARVLAFCTTGRPKNLHHISTLGVFSASSSSTLLHEDVDLEAVPLPSIGYSQSKWVAERMVAAARERGVLANIYRVGEVGPHSITGRPSERGLVDALLAAAVTHRRYPEVPLGIDFIPVDYVAKLVLAAIVTGEMGHAYHISQSTTVGLDELFDALTKLVPMEQVSYERFWQGLGSDEPSARLRTVLPEPTGAPDRDLAQLAGLLLAGTRRIESSRADRLAQASGLTMPERSALLRLYTMSCVASIELGRSRTTFDGMQIIMNDRGWTHEGAVVRE